jgi:hypothetical protein
MLANSSMDKVFGNNQTSHWVQTVRTYRLSCVRTKGLNVLLAANSGACSVKFVFRIVGFADGVVQVGKQSRQSVITFRVSFESLVVGLQAPGWVDEEDESHHDLMTAKPYGK